MSQSLDLNLDLSTSKSTLRHMMGTGVPMNHSAASSNEKRITPGRKHQRHSTEIGSEYHRWWTVRSCLGFHTNEQIAGLLLDGFYALLENIVTSAGGRSFECDSTLNESRAQYRGKKRTYPSSFRASSSSSSSGVFSSSSSSSPSQFFSSRMASSFSPTGEDVLYNDGIDHYTDAIWTMFGQSQHSLDQVEKARKKKYAGKPSPMAMPVSLPQDIRLIPPITPISTIYPGNGLMTTADNHMRAAPSDDQTPLATSVHKPVTLAKSDTVKVNLAENSTGSGSSYLDSMFPQALSYPTGPEHKTPGLPLSQRQSYSTEMMAVDGESSQKFRQRPHQSYPGYVEEVPTQKWPVESVDMGVPDGNSQVSNSSNIHHPNAVPNFLNDGSPVESIKSTSRREGGPSWIEATKKEDGSFLHHPCPQEDQRSVSSFSEPPDPTRKSHQASSSLQNVRPSSESTGISLHHLIDAKIEPFTPAFPPTSIGDKPSTYPSTHPAPMPPQLSGKLFPPTSTMGASLLFYPAHSLHHQDNSLASLSSLVQNIVYNSQSSILKPLPSTPSESSTHGSLTNQKKTLYPLTQENVLDVKDIPMPPKVSSLSNVRLVTPSPTMPGTKPNVLPVILAPSLNMGPRHSSTTSSDIVSLPVNQTPTTFLPPSSLSVRQNNSMMVNFSVYKMSQDRKLPQSTPTLTAAAPDLHSVSSCSDSCLIIRDVRSCKEDHHHSPTGVHPDRRCEDTPPSILKEKQNPPVCYESTLSHNRSLESFINKCHKYDNGNHPDETESKAHAPNTTFSHNPLKGSGTLLTTDENSYSRQPPFPVIGCRFGGRGIPAVVHSEKSGSQTLPFLLSGERCSSYRDNPVVKNETMSTTGAAKSGHASHDPSSTSTYFSNAYKNTASEVPTRLPTVMTQQASCHKAPVLATAPLSQQPLQPKAAYLSREPSPQADRRQARTEKAAKASNTSNGKQSKRESLRNLTCYSCSIVFCSATDLLVHRQELHSYVCGECDGRFLSKKTLQQHKLTDHPQIMKCSSCRFSSFSEDAFAKHMWCEHGTKFEGSIKRKRYSLEGSGSNESLSENAIETKPAKDYRLRSHSTQPAKDDEDDHDTHSNLQPRDGSPNPLRPHVDNLNPSPESDLPSSADVMANFLTRENVPASPLTQANEKDHGKVYNKVKCEATHPIITGPVFPSFRKEVPETTPSNLRNIVDMYNQVNEHCRLDSTDFLFQTAITNTHASNTSSRDLPSCLSSESTEHSGNSGNRKRESQLASRDDQEDNSEPLCLVVHDRQSGREKETSKNRPHNDDSHSELGKRLSNKSQGPEGGENVRANQFYETTNEKGDYGCDENQDELKFPPRNAGGRRKREMPARNANLSVSIDQDHEMRKRKRLPAMTEKNYDVASKEMQSECNKTLVLNVDENRMLSLRMKRTRSGSDTNHPSRTKNAFTSETGDSIGEPCLEIDYADEGYHHLETNFYDDVHNKSTAIPQESHNDQLYSPFRMKKDDDNMQDTRTLDADSRNRNRTRFSYQKVISNSRIASLRERKYPGHSSPRKQTSRRTTRSAKQNSNTNDYETPTNDDLDQDQGQVESNLKQGQRRQQHHHHHHHQQQQQRQQQQQQQQQQEQQQEHKNLQHQRYLQHETTDSRCERGGSSVKRQRYHCPIENCPSTFSRKWSMDCHVKKFHRDRFVCQLRGCAMVCDNKADLLRHVSLDHRDSKRKWQCLYTHSQANFDDREGLPAMVESPCAPGT